MSSALVRYVERRYDGHSESVAPEKLPPWRLRRIAEYVEAHLDETIRIPALAALVGLSEGHLHRSFRLTTGRTPLQFINERRIQRAMEILSNGAVPVSALALQVGFTSPSHFARIFRAVTGVAPARYRKDLKRETLQDRKP